MELMIPLNTKGPGPMYEQIYRFIKEEIRQGNLTAGAPALYPCPGGESEGQPQYNTDGLRTASFRRIY